MPITCNNEEIHFNQARDQLSMHPPMKWQMEKLLT
jgi:hypothetical protein